MPPPLGCKRGADFLRVEPASLLEELQVVHEATSFAEVYSCSTVFAPTKPRFQRSKRRSSSFAHSPHHGNKSHLQPLKLHGQQTYELSVR